MNTDTKTPPKTTIESLHELMQEHGMRPSAHIQDDIMLLATKLHAQAEFTTILQAMNEDRGEHSMAHRVQNTLKAGFNSAPLIGAEDRHRDAVKLDGDKDQTFMIGAKAAYQLKQLRAIAEALVAEQQHTKASPIATLAAA